MAWVRVAIKWNNCVVWCASEWLNAGMIGRYQNDGMVENLGLWISEDLVWTARKCWRLGGNQMN